MAEIRCPMCSRMNPAELDVCQYCQARLKPLILHPTPEPDPVPQNGKTGQGEMEEGTPDWLRSLRERKVQEELPAEPAPEEPAAPAPVEQALPDWQVSEYAAAGDDSLDENEDADWLERIRQRNQQEQQSQPDDLADGLSWNMDAVEETASPDDAPASSDEPVGEPEPGASGDSDWLLRLRTHPLDPSRVTGAEPDASAVSPIDIPASPSEASPAPQNEPPLSNWGDFSNWDSKPEENGSVTPLPSEPEETVPAWLQNSLSENPLPALEAKETEYPADPQPAETQPSAEEFSPAPGDAAGKESGDDLPETGPLPFLPLTDAELQQAAQSEGSIFTSDLPDWDEPADHPTDQPAGLDATPAQEFEFDSSSTKPMIAWEDGVLPDWLAALQSDVEEPPQPSEEPAAIPGALLDLGPSEEPSTAPDLSDAGEPEMPDWLVGLGAVENTAEDEADITAEAEPAPEEIPAAEGEALPAELPNWVQAMRPIETIAAEPGASPEPESLTEKVGPLAGLQGVLPGHLLGEDYKKAPVYTVPLQLSETQSRYAQIMQDVIAAEAAPRAGVAPQTLSKPQRLLRSVVAVILLASIVYALISNVQIMPVPNLYPQEVLNVRETIESLPPDSQVLLVTDYEAALAGEMEASGSAVIDHLMARSAQMVVVSTQPNGMVLASNLFDKVWQQEKTDHQAYQSGEKLAYLGYLAGGPGGMLSFAQQPQAAVPALLSDGSSVWDRPLLAGIHTLADFDLVLVMTDSADTGRAWVEQVKPAQGDVPMLFVSSAQAYPVLYPYLDSQQIYGMVSGLSGGAAYEQIMQSSGLGTAYWNSFQTALLVAIALILIGGVINAILGAIKNHGPEGEA